MPGSYGLLIGAVLFIGDQFVSISGRLVEDWSLGVEERGGVSIVDPEKLIVMSPKIDA